MESQRRMQLTRQIMDLDRQMGQLIEAKSGRLHHKHVFFPSGNWSIVVALVLWLLFGSVLKVTEGIHEKTFTWVVLATVIFALLAIWRTIRHVMYRMTTRKSGYEMPESDEVRALRQKRDALKAELEKTKD